jgi:subtilisin-like proprotein convertase family protein
LGISFIFIAVAVSLEGAHAASDTGNLLENPDCEEPLDVFRPPWVELSGTDWKRRSSSPGAQSGTYYFFAGVSSFAELGQVVDLTPWANVIDDGRVSILVSDWVRSFDQTPLDTSQFEYFLRDASNQTLDSWTSPVMSNTDAWALLEDGRFVPEGTDNVQVILRSVRNSGSNNDGYHDNVSVKLYFGPVLDLVEPLTFRDGTIGDVGDGAGSEDAGEATISLATSPFDILQSSDFTIQIIEPLRLNGAGGSPETEVPMSPSDFSLPQFAIPAGPSGITEFELSAERQPTSPNQAPGDYEGLIRLRWQSTEDGVAVRSNELDIPVYFTVLPCPYDASDCNGNGLPDSCDIAMGMSEDCNGDGVPDGCSEYIDGASPGGMTPPDGTGEFVTHEIELDHEGLIQDLNVNLDIEHTWNGDLIVRLIHDGVTVVLLDRPGNGFFSDDGYDITLDDEGTGGPIDDATTGGPTVVSPPSYVPAESLSAFDGMDISGTWRIEISDNEFADTGRLRQYTLIFSIPDCNGNGIADTCDVDNGAADCDFNGVPDSCQIAQGEPDCNGNGVPDACELPGACELQRIGGPDTQSPAEYFGSAVSVSGDVALVAAPGVPPGGAAYVYRFNEGAGLWIEEQVLTEISTTVFDFYGRSVAIDGDVAVVTAENSDAMGEYSGTAFVYRFDGLQWSLEQQLFASDAAEYMLFGSSVDVLDDVIIIGANGDSEEAAYVFRYDSGAGSWQEQAKLTASDATGDDSFGRSVALGIRSAVIGASSADTVGGNNAGAVYVFVYDDLFETWSEFEKLTAADGAAGDFFGASVAMSRDVAGFPRYIAVGAHSNDEGELSQTGAAYLFEWRLDGITPNGKLVSNDAEAGDVLGYSVSLDGLTCAAGAYGRNHLIGLNQGAVYVFRRTGEAPGDPWVEQMTLLSSTQLSFSGYAQDIALSGPWMFVGAFDEIGSQGAAYIVGGMGDCNDNGVVDCADIFCETSNDADSDATPDECAPPCPGDLTGDGEINSVDLFLLLGVWGSCPACPEDLNGDGSVNSVDLFQLLGAWGVCLD